MKLRPQQTPVQTGFTLSASADTLNVVAGGTTMITVTAVRNVDLTVAKGETVGIVGESGSGKSVTCYSMMRLIPQPPGRIEGGTAIFDGTDLLNCSKEQLSAIRGRRVAMIFQMIMGKAA